MGCGKSDGRTRRGDLEPFSGVLRSLTRDLFKSQPPGERKTVGFRLGEGFEKVIPSLIGANGPSARRMDDKRGTTRFLAVVQ